MSDLLTYITKVAIIQTALVLCYWVLHRRDTFYRLVRFYFLTGLVFSYVFPLIRFEIELPSLSYHAEDFIAQPFSQDILSPDINIADSNLSVLTNVAWGAKYTLTHYTLLVLFIGIFLMSGRFILQYIKLIRLQAIPYYSCRTHTILNVEAPIKPFSFGKRIYLNVRLHNPQELDEIIQHELVHIDQRHTADILLCGINKCLFWWNPAIWWLNRLIRNNLEYIVDDEMLQRGFDRKHYQYHLLHISQLGYSNSIANHFNLSNLKKRIKMMNKEKTKDFYKIKSLLVLPVAAVLFVLFNLTKTTAAELPRDNENVGYTTYNESDSSSHNQVTIYTFTDIINLNKNQRTGLTINKNQFNIDEQSFKTEGYKNPDTTYASKIILHSQNEELVTITNNQNGTISTLKTNIPVNGKQTEYMYVMDGKVVNKEIFGTIDPKQIKYMRIDKGDSAVKMYGEKAAQGVIEFFVKNQPHSDSKHLENKYADIKISGTNNLDNELLYIVDNRKINQEDFIKLDKNRIRYINILRDKEFEEKYGGETKGKNGVLEIFIDTDPPQSAKNNKVEIYSGSNLTGIINVNPNPDSLLQGSIQQIRM